MNEPRDIQYDELIVVFLQYGDKYSNAAQLNLIDVSLHDDQ
jgi:hypothetical protein